MACAVACCIDCVRRLPGGVLGADHPAQAGAGGSEIGFRNGEAFLQGGVLGGRLPKLAGELLVGLGELVDAGGQITCGKNVELLPELVAHRGAEPVSVGPQLLDFLAGQVEFDAQCCWCGGRIVVPGGCG
ncbi:hypothetical protein [Streptomyces sp. NPDC026673]|uniref:hypothetical protein n=1 Tax=Streptomyces sp. NPDC026673 TaxID=3155724 RepID=UPI0033F77542